MLISLMSFSILLTSCKMVLPHDNFKAHMENNIGKNINDPTANWVGDRYFVNSKQLSNGNIENQYFFWKTCKYYFEIDPVTLIILNWRFEGDKRDCRISP